MKIYLIEHFQIDDYEDFEMKTMYYITTGHRAIEYQRKDGSLVFRVITRMCRQTPKNSKIFNQIKEFVEQHKKRNEE